MKPPSSTPLVSIGLPVYNGENYVADAIESLLAQTFIDFELIISDNQSTDTTDEICRSFAERDPRIRYSRNEENIGGARNFNRTFELARGKYFRWAAHDDTCQPEFIERCVEVLERDPGVVLCHSKVAIIDHAGNHQKNYDLALPGTSSDRPQDRFDDLILIGHLCFEMFGVIRADVLARTPLIATYVGSDRNLLAELGLHGRYFEVPERLMNIRYHEGRSVSKPRHERTEWFNPGKRGSKQMPYWRSGSEYLQSIMRVPLEPQERRACLVHLSRWLRSNWRFLRGDVRIALGLRGRRRGS